MRKLWLVLSSAQRRSAKGLLVLMLIGMVLETLGISVVVPALGLIVESDAGNRNPVLAPLLRYRGNAASETVVVVAMLALVGIYAIKALFLGFLAWRQMRFIYRLQADLSQRLFAGYLSQPYAFHLQRNSAQLIRNVTNEVERFSGGLQALLGLLTEGLVMFGIVAFLIAIEPFGALVAALMLGGAGWLLNRLTRTRIQHWGEALQFHHGMQIQHVQQGLGCAKDVKLLGREADFLAHYRIHNDGSARSWECITTLQQLPRLGLELLAVTGLASLVISMIAQGRELAAIVPTMGAFAAAAFRLMPSVNRMVSGIQSIHFTQAAVDIVHAEIGNSDAAPAPAIALPLPLRRAIVFENVSYRYSSAEGVVLQGVSLSISLGSSVGFIGASGAGKSTLVDVLLGLLTPTDGKVYVDGIDIQANLRGWQDQIGYVPQSIFLTDDTLRRNIALGIPDERIDDLAVRRALRAAHLEPFINELPQGINTLVGERGIRLSGGQRQRIGIARALYHDPQVLILDEATSSLDSATERSVLDAVWALHGSKTLILVAHRLSTVRRCDCLFRLEQGRLVEQGTYSQVVEKQTM